MPVSELEKKAEISSSTSNAPNNALNGMSFTDLGPPEDQFKDYLSAEEGEHKHYKTG